MAQESKNENKIKVRFHTSKGVYQSGQVYELTEAQLKEFAPCISVLLKKGGN